VLSIDDEMQSSIIDDEDASLAIELLSDDAGQLDDVELSIAELDEASWAKPGTTAAAKPPATSSAPIKASSFFMILLRERFLARRPCG
jgi:hypothetical protein